MPQEYDYVIIRDPDAENSSRGANEILNTIEVETVNLTQTESRDAANDPTVKMMAPAMPMKLIEPIEMGGAIPDESQSRTWGIEAVRAHESSFDGAGIIVAVLDSGIDPDHSAFAGVNLVQKNFTQSVDGDTSGHGTHCAGTIFGRDVDGKRIGVARGIDKALIGKVLGSGSSSASVANAILWAVQEGAHIISMSLGIDFPGAVERRVNRGINVNAATSMTLEEYRANINLFSELVSLINQLSSQTIIIAASGNESERPEYVVSVAPPAAGTGLIAVGALQKLDEGLVVAPFSNNKVDISGPGFGILSANRGGGLTSKNGTSMATPHVAGVAALWAQRQLRQTGQIDQGMLKAQLIANGTYEPVVDGWLVDDVGSGLVQAPI